MTFKQFQKICKKSCCSECDFRKDFCKGCGEESGFDSDIMSSDFWNSLTDVHKKIYLKYSRREKLRKLLS